MSLTGGDGAGSAEHTDAQTRLGHTANQNTTRQTSQASASLQEGAHLTVQQLSSVEVFPLRTGSEGREGGGPRRAAPQLLLQLLVEFELFEGAVLLDAVLELGSQTPHLPQQLPQLHWQTWEFTQVA